MEDGTREDNRGIAEGERIALSHDICKMKSSHRGETQGGLIQ